MINKQFQCVNTTCLPFVIDIVLDIRDCQFMCLSQIQCQATSFHKSTSTCDLFDDILNQIGNMLDNADIVTMIVMSETRIPVGMTSSSVAAPSITSLTTPLTATLVTTTTTVC
ncbi:unnamed protein product [Adineta steineri]|uniref:Apple domain-containing protein n=1 Tax=Adineta steineri TaxID=433720 RepID=A0A813ZIB1_9BILA|nr:unnamed protein product [Adineta steineri]CAF0902607.1 unnamed protein product [Adineta steineri]CAF0928213.1 unnamed protein product [Adineta steineri]